MKKTILFFIFYTITAALYGQNLWDVYKKVEKKLKNDAKYLDLYSINFTPNQDELPYLQNIPLGFSKKTYSFDSRTNYSIVFIKETIEIDSVVLLYVYDVVNSGGGSDSNSLIVSNTGSRSDTVNVLSYTDLQELYFSSVNKKYYDELYRIVAATIHEQEPKPLLGIEVSKELKKSKGFSSENNSDYLNYLYVNSIFKYPPLKTHTPVQRRGRVKNEVVGTEYQISASLNHVTFTHNMLQFPYYSLSAELNTGDELLNILPYQNMTVSGGIRGLITFSGDEQNLMKDVILDIRLLGKGRADFSKFSHKIPFIFSDAAKLNVTSGFIANIKASQLYDFPFLNLYLSAGSKDFTDPFVKFGKRDSSYAFFTSFQWRFMFSFFWNANERSDLRFKMDVGLGNHDVVKVVYNKNKVTENLVSNRIKPIVGINISFVPKNTELINLDLRYYDNIIKGDVWFKVFEIQPHVFRLGGVFLSAPVFRNVKEWEVEGSGMIQIHYRYGF